MTVKSQTRQIVYIAAMAGMAFTLVGCDSFREAAGLTKEAPDEFAVVTKAPLIIPPDYNLKPPKPGAAPTNQVSPTDTAEAALYGQPALATSNTGQLSAGEQAVLAKAGASDANDMIRQMIAADNHAMQVSDESFTNKLLFGAGTDSSGGTPVDANAESRRLNGGQTDGAAGNNDAIPAQPARDDGKTTIQDAVGGWLGDIF